MNPNPLSLNIVQEKVKMIHVIFNFDYCCIARSKHVFL